jgi:superfamily I DNA/RNA helicase
LENGLELEASHGGQALGDSARVRIFPVEFIKGLEFEAVFYVGLDRMAEIHKDLIDNYVYVGLSRARSFLGVTIERQFPPRLKSIADHFVQDGSWAPNPVA